MTPESEAKTGPGRSQNNEVAGHCREMLGPWMVVLGIVQRVHSWEHLFLLCSSPSNHAVPAASGPS